MYSQWASRCHRGKESACQHRRHKRREFDPWARKSPWIFKWQPVPVFLPAPLPQTEEPAGYSAWDRRTVGHN